MNHSGILIWFMLLTLMTPRSEASDSPEMDPALMARFYADPPATGLLITRLFPGGTAVDSELKPGDPIISYNGSVSESRTQFTKMVTSTSSDARISILVLRGSEQKLLQVPGGKIGVIIIFLRKGVPNTTGKMNDLPLASPAIELDLSVLKSHSHLESWYTLYFNDQSVGALSDRSTEVIVEQADEGVVRLDALDEIMRPYEMPVHLSEPGLSQKEFNNRMNDPTLYQLEDPASNRRHRDEAP